MRNPLMITVALAAVLSVAGCGGSEPSTSPTDAAGAPTSAPSSQAPDKAATDICALVTDAEVAGIFGTAGTVDDKKAGRDCVWTGNKAGLHQLHVQVYTGKHYYSTSAWGTTPEAVSGLGDEAFLIRKAGLGATVGVLNGETAVFVNYQILLTRDANPGAKADDLIALTRAILERL